MDYTIRYVGVCGSDILRLDMGQPLRSLGHEIVAQNDHGWYAINPLIPCGQCTLCLSEKTRFCTKLQSLGKDGKGGFDGGRVTVPDYSVVLLTTTHPEVYVLADPLACVLHGLSLINRPIGEVAVIGDGVIAELVCSILADRGVTTVQVVKRRRTKCDIPNRKRITQDQLSSSYYLTAILCVGGVKPEALNCALDALAASGTLLVMGAFHALESGLNTRALLTKEITLIGSYSFEPDNFASAVQEISRSETKYREYITDVIAAGLIDEAVFRHRTDDNRLKVVIQF